MSRERGVSTVVGYTLTLGITTLLISGLLIGAGGFIQDQRERAIRSELEVVGQQIAADIETGDRFVGAGETDFTISRAIPNNAVGIDYRVEVVSDSQWETYLRLSTENPDVTVEVDMVVVSDLRDSTVTGGPIVVTYDSGAIEVRSDG
jgi:hypothetical protein